MAFGGGFGGKKPGMGMGIGAPGRPPEADPMGGGMGGEDPRIAAKKRMLDEIMQWSSGGMGGEMKAKYRPAPAPPETPAGYMDPDGVLVDKSGVTGPDGTPEGDPSLLLQDLDQDAIMKLLGNTDDMQDDTMPTDAPADAPMDGMPQYDPAQDEEDPTAGF